MQSWVVYLSARSFQNAVRYRVVGKMLKELVLPPVDGAARL